jgi:hypothetical protein
MVPMNKVADGQAKLIAIAERELSGFFSAVGELFGPEEPALAAKDWLQQLKVMKTLPVLPRQFRQLSINASGRPTKRLGSDG